MAAPAVPDADLEQRLLAEVDALEPELIALASELVRTRSVNPRYPSADFDAEVGGEGRCARAIERALQGSGLELELIASEPGRDNLAAVLRGSGGGRRMILNGHIDTVTAGDVSAWRRDPWSGQVEDGSVWGLGASDMKGPVAAGAIALKALARHREALRGDVVLQCVVGEESSEADKGAVAVLEHGYVGDAGICMEPTGRIAAGRRHLALAPVALGTLILRFTIEGRAVHAGRRRDAISAGSGSRSGVSVWEKGVHLTGALARLEQNWAFTRRSPYYPAGHFILNPGVVSSRAKGADSAFFVPDEFVAEYVIFYSPHDSRETIREEVADCLMTAAAQDEWLVDHPPAIEWLPSIPGSEISEEHELFGITRDAIVAVTGEAPSIQGLSAGCDAGWLCEAGIPTLVYGPGDIASAHSPNESVVVADLVQAAKVYALAALRFCR